MASRARTLLLPLAVTALVLVLHAASCVAQSDEPVTSGWSAIPDAANNPDLFSVASFAATSHSEDQSLDLRVIAVLSALSQIVAGTNFNVSFVAVDMALSPSAPQAAEYHAVVFQSLDGGMELTAFEEVNGSARPATADEIATAQMAESGGLVGEGGGEGEGEGGGMMGGWASVADPSGDASVVRAAEFAVEEANKRDGTKLTLVNIEAAQTQVVAGTNFNITMNAFDQSTNAGGQYVAVVWEEVGPERVLNLTSLTFIQASMYKGAPGPMPPAAAPSAAPGTGTSAGGGGNSSSSSGGGGNTTAQPSSAFSPLVGLNVWTTFAAAATVGLTLFL